MIPAISNNRRNEIKAVVLSALEHGKQFELPVRIGTIIRSYDNIKLITYSSQIEKHSITYRELLISAETEDSYVVYNWFHRKYCIYYNDIDINIRTSNRIRWNLAHELGHVLLEHHNLCDKEKLQRGDMFLDNIDQKNYKIAEEEADYFAQLILVPHVVLKGLHVRFQRELRYLCKISDKAAKWRIRDYNQWKLNINKNDDYDKRIFRYYYNFIYKKKCKKCDSGIIQRYGKYCTICGSKNTLEWGDGKMFYELLDSHENGKLKMCPICKNEDTDISGSYCQICGVNLINHCTNPDCEQELPTNARYCPHCGDTSSFYQRDILESWNHRTFSSNMSFMSIPDDIDEELPFN